MSALEALGIAGFRSYSPESLQKIDFQSPLTLIWGKNGCGKTTIIEVLKYITTGALPPNSDKGKNFVMDPKLIGQAQIIGDTRLKFKAFNGRPVLAKRRALLSATSKAKKFESIEQTLKTKDQKGQLFEINHHCAEIEKQIPQLLGISKSVLQNIVFCHQDESLWPFSDSINLKTIFDEMFETKKYTKIIQAFWDQHKQYTKQTKQSKKALEYMKRIYDDDNLKKRTALRDMEKISNESQILLSMRQSLQKIETELSMLNNNSTNRKFELIMKRGSLQQKIKNGNKILRQYKQRLEIISLEYTQTFQTVISNDYTPEQIDLKISQASKQKQGIEQELEQSKNANIYSQKQIQIMTEMRRAQECLPELKRQSQQGILAKLQMKVQQLEKKRHELKQSKLQLEKLVIPNTLDMPMSQSTYKQHRQLYLKQSQRLQSLKSQVVGSFWYLFKKVDLKRLRQFDSNIQQQLKEIKLKVKLKKQQLCKYKSMPSVQSLSERRFKLKYAGIQLQQNIYSFCCENKKCFYCSRSISEGELAAIKAKTDKTIKKAQQKLSKMNESASAEEQSVIDPQKMVSILSKQIQKAEQIQRRLSTRYQEYVIYKQQIEQGKINQRITACMKKAGLEREADTPADKMLTCTIQSFIQLINQYQFLKLRIESKGKQIQIFQQRINRNKEILQQRLTAQDQAKKWQTIISNLEEELKNYEIILNITKRLSGLLSLRGKKSAYRSSQSESSNPEDLQKQLAEASLRLRNLALQKEYSQTLAKNRILEGQVRKMLDEFKQVDSSLRAIDGEVEQFNRKSQEYNRCKMEYIEKKREIDLKAEIIFQQFYKPMEKEYLIKKMEYQTKQAAAKDLQAFCKALQTSISNFHKQKMDEVNKYLAEIWRQVYHGDDIGHIEIQTDFEDAKHRKSYNYTIVMQKNIGKSKMQMKGRCSMGQKVLASIVIRLALAEVFSNSARILALDQPTTNLDRQHIVNLAQQLGRLIELNEHRYLQMIIISHDIQFIKLLQRYTGSYYEVSRDERNFSVIKKKNIREMLQQL